ncbi:ferredoxin--NADP(+) reductase [Vibrio ichthyoenteri ATCC 700023]|uniref:ferredoxin--NADP(+) reductase n=1 Tax=Vibrio ichthyoenteri ATCC 700023 TaxID=870968 RepID=F9RYX5_9VIBR|nr:ferredoxin--NADP reductase [Vibrio ichthyoenteri]EGU46237.1 ferredoxin--NADP(+) reductase [Vibrio ichthyoenteri ATCC 700023]
MGEIAGYSQAIVAKRTDWTKEIFSLRLSGANLSFKAGQFTKLALVDDEGHTISRAYSLVNAPLTSSDMLEFLIVANESGQLSPRLHQLKEGQTIYVGQRANGDLTFESIPKQSEELWLLSTGTGIGPFLALLDDINFRPHNRRIVLVHGVRHQSDLVYRYLINQLVEQYEGRLIYQPVVSRQHIEGALFGRIPALIDSGELMNSTQTEFDAQKSFVMLCGNPEMIKDTLNTLTARGLAKHRAAQPGNIMYERYW